MNLGKTLQAVRVDCCVANCKSRYQITLIWTLLKDGPKGKPTVKKAIVVVRALLLIPTRS